MHKQLLAILALFVAATAGAQDSPAVEAVKRLRASASLSQRATPLVVGEVRLIALPDGGAVNVRTSALRSDGWLPCDGSRISVTEYSDLFTAIGHSWETQTGAGVPDTFQLPDLKDIRSSSRSVRGRLVYFIHAGKPRSRPKDARSPGETIDALK